MDDDCDTTSGNAGDFYWRFGCKLDGVVGPLMSLLDDYNMDDGDSFNLAESKIFIATNDQNLEYYGYIVEDNDFDSPAVFATYFDDFENKSEIKETTSGTIDLDGCEFYHEVNNYHVGYDVKVE